MQIRKKNEGDKPNDVLVMTVHLYVYFRSKSIFFKMINIKYVLLTFQLRIKIRLIRKSFYNLTQVLQN